MSENGDERLDVGRLIRESFADEGPFRLHVRTAREFSAMPDPPNLELLGPLVSRAGRTIVVGDTGHGKTTLCLQMLSAIVSGDEMLGWEGAGLGPVLVVDLEQGTRSIKRALRESRLDARDDVLYVSQPDGLALDQEREHLLALVDVIGEHRPSVVLLDPYYKAHRADDPNAERPIIDLMRTLDSLRTSYDFALILPAHPRKDVPGREGARKLTIHDVAGSGAVTRGAEIVVAVERLGSGFARLRYLKDRDGDLAVGEATTLLYSKDEGYRLDPRSTETDDGVERAILSASFGWATTREWAQELKVQHVRVKRILEALSEGPERRVAFAIGPSGRSRRARCYSTVPEHLEQFGTVEQLEVDPATVPTDPTSLKGRVSVGTVGRPAREPEQYDVDEGSDDPDYPFG